MGNRLMKVWDILYGEDTKGISLQEALVVDDRMLGVRALRGLITSLAKERVSPLVWPGLLVV